AGLSPAPVEQDEGGDGGDGEERALHEGPPSQLFSLSLRRCWRRRGSPPGGGSPERWFATAPYQQSAEVLCVELADALHELLIEGELWGAAWPPCPVHRTD